MLYYLNNYIDDNIIGGEVALCKASKSQPKETQDFKGGQL